MNVYRETELGLFSIWEIKPKKIYVSFPGSHYVPAPGVPYEVQEWLFKTIGNNVEWGIACGRRVGVFLTEEDATAFRLRFGI